MCLLDHLTKESTPPQCRYDHVSCDYHVTILWLTQNTMFKTAKVVFARAPKITDVEIDMPNIHYYVADLSKLKLPNSGEVCDVCVMCMMCVRINN